MDQDGEVVDVFLQARRDGAAAKRFFKRLVQNLFNLGRPLVGVQHYRDLRIGAFGEWDRAVASDQIVAFSGLNE